MNKKEEIIQDGDYLRIGGKIYKKTPVAGFLYFPGHHRDEFILLKPDPIVPDSWQRDEKTFLCVDEFDWKLVGKEKLAKVYSIPFHITVSGTWAVILNPPEDGYIWVETDQQYYDVLTR